MTAVTVTVMERKQCCQLYFKEFTNCGNVNHQKPLRVWRMAHITQRLYFSTDTKGHSRHSATKSLDLARHPKDLEVSMFCEMFLGLFDSLYNIKAEY